MNTSSKPILQFQLDPASGAWNVFRPAERSPALRNARITIDFSDRGKRIECALRDFRTVPARPPWSGGASGDFRNQRFEAEAGSRLLVAVQWSASTEKPFVQWRVVLTNLATEPLKIHSIDMCRAGRRFGAEGGVELPISPADRAMFVNGWQSWSFAGGRGSADRQPGPMLGPFDRPMHAGTSLRSTGRPGHFVSDMFTSIGRRLGEDALIAGFLSQNEQFGAVETWLQDDVLSLRMRADCDGVRLDGGASLATDWAYLALGPRATAEDYFDAAADGNGARADRAAPEGWCSWYYYHTAVSQADLEKNTDAARALRARLPLKMIQLDDGYAADVGDWFERGPKFPSTLREISDRIRAAGFTPGIWISPFIVRPGSRMQREHPQWLAGGVQGVMSNVKITWLRDTLTLDVTRPEVADYLRHLIRTAVKEWKFPFLKLDYLYLPAARHVKFSDPTVTRAQALRKALTIIRQAAGEKTYLLGCGCPLGSGIGIFDGMRIGPDVDPVWKPHVFGRVWAARGDPTVPAAANAARNMLTRAPLHRRWWWNDPDCLLARDTETHLTAGERRTLAAAIALSGGMVLLSDDLSALSTDSLRLAQSLFPPLYRAATFPGLRGETPPRVAILPMRGPQGKWWVIGLFNWSDREGTESIRLHEFLHLPEEMMARSFWDGRMLESREGILESPAIPAHGSILLAVQPLTGGVQYIGSDLHFSQGAEVADWKLSRTGLTARLRLKREAEGNIWLALPGIPSNASIDGTPIRAEHILKNIWKLPVKFAGAGELKIQWQTPKK